MPVTDTIADMLTVIRNGVMAHKESVEVKRSKVSENILKILKKEDFIANYKAIDDKRQGILKAYLRYEKDKTPAIAGLKRISKPGRRVYVNNKEIKEVYGGLGVALISTSKGVMTDREAKEKKLGGELICEVW
ncbi:MAG: 30S ribosomal protein S8 [Candidatus Omnitrophica bacterium]|nr:30S ribosomal protein S8 [Candidatus Omnitrophota bacterium]